MTRQPGLQVLRGAMVLATLSFHFSGLHFIPLAEATAILFIAPILVTALSFPLLGERVAPALWGAVFIGFAGALIVIRPGFGVMQLAALLPIGAACTFAGYQIAGRILSRTDSAITTLTYTVWVGAVAASLVVPFFWKTPDLLGWTQIAGLGLFAGFGQFALIKAFEAAPAATVTPFYLFWAGVGDASRLRRVRGPARFLDRHRGAAHRFQRRLHPLPGARSARVGPGAVHDRRESHKAASAARRLSGAPAQARTLRSAAVSDNDLERVRSEPL